MTHDNIIGKLFGNKWKSFLSCFLFFLLVGQPEDYKLISDQSLKMSSPHPRGNDRFDSVVSPEDGRGSDSSYGRRTSPNDGRGSEDSLIGKQWNAQQKKHVFKLRKYSIKSFSKLICFQINDILTNCFLV